MHTIFIQRCQVREINRSDIDYILKFKSYPEKYIGDEILVLCSNVSHKNLPSSLVTINKDELYNFVKDTCIGSNYNGGFDSRTDIFATVDFIKRFKTDSKYLFRNPKITHAFSVLIFDKIIIEMTRIYNELYDFEEGSINEHIISRC